MKPASARFLVAALLAVVLGACDDDKMGPGNPGGVIFGEPPVIAALPDTFAVVGDTLRLRVSFSDPDGDDVTVYLTPGPPSSGGDAFLDSITGDFWFAPNASDRPSRSMVITAVDEWGDSSSVQLAITVMDFYRDQVADTGSIGVGQNVDAFKPFGQEFVPDLGAVDIVQLRFEGQTYDATLVINIRSSTITGPILGSSAPREFSAGFHGVATFDIERVSLTPGERYVIEVVQLSGRNWMGESFARPAYDRGRQILRGEPQENNDLWFREGVKAPLPPGSAFVKGD